MKDDMELETRNTKGSEIVYPAKSNLVNRDRAATINLKPK